MNGKPTERKALGRGLSALLPAASGGGRGGDFVDCPLDRLDFPAFQPRQHFDDERLAELAESIRTKGLLQPIVVTRVGDRYQLIAGERRVRAAKLAGLRSVPAVVKDLAPEDVFEIALIENIQREDLNPIEEAEAYQRLAEERGYSQEELARRVGRERSTVANALRLLQLDGEARAHIAGGRLTAGHARALLAVDEAPARTALLQEILDEGLSVREAEARARDRRAPRVAAPRKPRTRPLSPLHEIVAREIGERLGCAVQVLPTSRRSGRVVITYESLETLSRIHRRITESDGAVGTDN